MDEPIRSGRSGSEGILQTAVESLHEAVGLRMVGGCLSVCDGEKRTKAGPQRRSELRAPVACYGVRHSESLNPSLEEGRCAVGGGGGSERNCLWPASCSVNHREQIHKT
jgi:hypothetical protein